MVPTAAPGDMGMAAPAPPCTKCRATSMAAGAVPNAHAAVAAPDSSENGPGGCSRFDVGGTAAAAAIASWRVTACAAAAAATAVAAVAASAVTRTSSSAVVTAAASVEMYASCPRARLGGGAEAPTAPAPVRFLDMTLFS